jgi:hypothetical protein
MTRPPHPLHDRLRAEHEKGRKATTAFRQAWPEHVEDIGRRAIADAMIDDFHNTNTHSLDEYARNHGRLPTDSEIANAHLIHRAMGTAGFRSPSELVEATRREHGLRRRVLESEYGNHRNLRKTFDTFRGRSNP